MGLRTNTAVWYEKYHRWQIKVQKDGVRRTFTSSKPGRTGMRECHKKADEWLDDNVDNVNQKIQRIYPEYVDTLKETTSTSNWTKAESIGNNWILPNIGRIQIGKLNEQHLQNVINKAVAAGLAKKSIMNIRATALAFVKYCRKRKLTNLVPEDITIPKSVRSKGKRILQPHALKILFSTPLTTWRGKPVFDKYIYAYRFQVCTGLRPGELLALSWNDIKGNQISIKHSINALGEKTEGKNENTKRCFVLSSLAQSILAKQKKMHPFGLIFDISSQEHYRHCWERYCRSNEIEYVTPYELRHTFVSIAKQLPEGEVKMLVGHSQNMDTFGVYGHEVNGESEKTANELEKLFASYLK